jgi:hypothetical protein
MGYRLAGRELEDHTDQNPIHRDGHQADSNRYLSPGIDSADRIQHNDSSVSQRNIGGILEVKIIKDTRGSAPLWAAFIAFVLCILAIVAYTGATLYSKYQAAQTELERAANISIDRNMVNSNVRDLLLDIPAVPTLVEFEDNLADAGWEQVSDGAWDKRVDGKLIYAVRGLDADVHDRYLDISCSLVLPLPWAMGNFSEVEIPMAVRSEVLYLN